MSEPLVKAVANLLLQMNGAWVVASDEEAFDRAFKKVLEEMRKIDEQSA